LEETPVSTYDKSALVPYTEGGFIAKLIPLHPWDKIDNMDRERGKSPRDGNWRNTEYGLTAITEAMGLGFNIGVRLSEHDLVVDMDPRNMDVTCEAAIASMNSQFNCDLNHSPTVRTGSGGLHIYLKLPQDWVGKKFRNEIEAYPGVEFKAVGRQVVAAGSKHPNGTVYAWCSDTDLANRPEVTVELLKAIERKAPKRNGGQEDKVISRKDLEEYLSVIPAEDFSDNESWLKLAMACYHATDGEGIEEFVTWSLSDPQYAADEEVIRMRWASFSGGGGITAATLFKTLGDYGRGDLIQSDPAEAFTEPLSEDDKDFLDSIPARVDNEGLFERNGNGVIKRTVANTMMAVRQLGIKPVKNALKDEIHIEGNFDLLREVYPMASSAFDDSMLHGMRHSIHRNFNFEPGLNHVHEAMVTLSLENEFHPVRDYLNSLEWDGVERVSSFLTTFCGADSNAYTAKVGEILLKAAVARAFKPGTKFDTMVILEGIQGCGKSTMLKILGGIWTLEGLPNRQDLNHKDVIQAIQGFWIVEVEELAIMRKSDVDSLKAFITRQTDKARFAYSREAKVYQRQCVFVGTTNDDEYLLDSTGNRRFLPISVGVIDLLGLKASRDQLWAEAVALWKAKPTEQSLMLPQSIWGDAAEQQEDRRVQDPIEFRIRDYLDEQSDKDFISVEEVLVNVLLKSPGSADMKDSRRINRAFKAIPDWVATRRMQVGKRVRGFERKAAL
jgi:hypothetical protein